MFHSKRVEYLGYVLDEEGLHTVPEKVQAIKDTPLPRNVRELRSLLGPFNYHRKFIPNLSTIVAPLNQLLQKHTKWVWSPACTRAVQEAKANLVDAIVLMHFDPTLPVVLATDASSYGIGAVLSHKCKDGLERPIAFCSRTLTQTEVNYAQLEKEALSIVNGVKKFHQYLYGKSLNDFPYRYYRPQTFNLYF